MDDEECRGCRWQHTCRTEVDRKESTSRVYDSPVRRNYRGSYRSRYNQDEDVASVHESGVIEEGEKPIERFAKDAAAGALRGMFYEMWQFMRNFRFR